MIRNSEREPLPYYRWFWRDWRASRRVQRMSWQAQGLFRTLLDEFWAVGILSDDLVELADICNCTLQEMELYWPEIAPCWEPVEGGYRNAKMDAQRTDTDMLRAAYARNGRAGGISKLASVSQYQAIAHSSEAIATAPQAIASGLQAIASDRHIAEQSKSISRVEQSKSTSLCPTVQEPSDRGAGKDETAPRQPAVAVRKKRGSHRPYDPGFERAYAAYPKHEEKSGSETEYLAAVKRLRRGERDKPAMPGEEPHVFLLAAAEDHARRMTAQARQPGKIRSMRRWLLHSTYLDYVPAPRMEIVELTPEEAAAQWERDFGGARNLARNLGNAGGSANA